MANSTARLSTFLVSANRLDSEGSKGVPRSSLLDVYSSESNGRDEKCRRTPVRRNSASKKVRSVATRAESLECLLLLVTPQGDATYTIKHSID